MWQCKICGKPLRGEFFSKKIGESVCSKCYVDLMKYKIITPKLIQEVRKSLGLKQGEYFKQCHYF